MRINNQEHLYFANRAFARFKLNDFNGSISDYQKALQRNPGNQSTEEQLLVLIELKER